MRIIAGRAGGVILRAPKGFEVRPTPDLVRQAIFNSLGQRVGGARVLELFAGTGALSLECLSRGATQALCVEKSSRHAEFIRENLVQSRLPAAAWPSRRVTRSPPSGRWLGRASNSISSWRTRLGARKTRPAAPPPSRSNCSTKRPCPLCCVPAASLFSGTPSETR